MPTINRNTKRKFWQPEPEKKTQFSEDASFYHTTAWRKLRGVYIKQHPLCECADCKKLPVPLPAEHVDHIRPIKDGGDPMSWENLQSLNRKCHNKKSAKERRQ